VRSAGFDRASKDFPWVWFETQHPAATHPRPFNVDYLFRRALAKVMSNTGSAVEWSEMSAKPSARLLKTLAAQYRKLQREDRGRQRRDK
jgi:hypothetical protein